MYESDSSDRGAEVVVFVGDAASAAESLARALGRVGYATTKAATIRDVGLDSRRPPAAVVMMAGEGVDPFRAVRIIRARPGFAHALVFVWALPAMDVPVGPAIASGADDVLVDGDGLDDMIDRVAARIARARTLHERATFDSVTQLRSRLFVTESLSLEIGRALRRHPRAAFAVLWLSGLAESRAERGFLAVEREVEQVAFTIAASVRPCDTACRVADDTFVVLFPGMDAEEAAAQLASERGRIAGKAASVGGVTSAFVEAPCDGVTWQELFDWAERQLSEIRAASVSGRQLVADVPA